MVRIALMLVWLLLATPLSADACDCKPPTADTTPPAGQELPWAHVDVANANAMTQAAIDAMDVTASFLWRDHEPMAVHDVITRVIVYVDGDPAVDNSGNGVFDGAPADTLLADIDATTLGLPTGPGTGGSAVTIQQSAVMSLALSQSVLVQAGGVVTRRLWIRVLICPDNAAFQAARTNQLDFACPGVFTSVAFTVTGVPVQDVSVTGGDAATFKFGKRIIGGCADEKCSADAGCSGAAKATAPLVLLALLVLIAFLRRGSATPMNPRRGRA